MQFDNNGYLTSGSVASGGATAGFSSYYEFKYNESGQIISYDLGQQRKASFIYDEGRLESINFLVSGSDIIDEAIEYEYDDQSHLVSATDSTIDVKYLFSCDEQNQITGVYIENKYGRASRYKIEYDIHGNLTVMNQFSYRGNFISKRTYLYEKTNELVFNHWLMRLSMAFVWRTANIVD